MVVLQLSTTAAMAIINAAKSSSEEEPSSSGPSSLSNSNLKKRQKLRPLSLINSTGGHRNSTQSLTRNSLEEPSSAGMAEFAYQKTM